MITEVQLASNLHTPSTRSSRSVPLFPRSKNSIFSDRIKSILPHRVHKLSSKKHNKRAVVPIDSQEGFQDHGSQARSLSISDDSTSSTRSATAPAAYDAASTGPVTYMGNYIPTYTFPPAYSLGTQVPAMPGPMVRGDIPPHAPFQRIPISDTVSSKPDLSTVGPLRTDLGPSQPERLYPSSAGHGPAPPPPAAAAAPPPQPVPIPTAARRQTRSIPLEMTQEMNMDPQRAESGQVLVPLHCIVDHSSLISPPGSSRYLADQAGQKFGMPVVFDQLATTSQRRSSDVSSISSSAGTGTSTSSFERLAGERHSIDNGYSPLRSQMDLPPSKDSSSVPSSKALSASIQSFGHSQNSPDIKRRTKTGCLTCRRRRVKCDEQRPHCRNCMKSERVCLAYDPVFTRARQDQLQDFSRRRKVQRNAWKMQISTLLEDSSNVRDSIPANEDFMTLVFTRGIRVKLSSWSQVAQLFRDHVSESLDLLLGTNLLFKMSHRAAEYFTVNDESIVDMAAEAEAMRQILIIVFPTVTFGQLNILDSDISLEKLRTSSSYHIMRFFMDALFTETCAESQSQHSLASASSPSKRSQFSEEHMQECFKRLCDLRDLLHCSTNHMSKLNKEEEHNIFNHFGNYSVCNRVAEKIVTHLSASIDDRQDFTSAVWESVRLVLDAREEVSAPASQPIPDAETSASLEPKCKELVERLRHKASRSDARGVLALLTLCAAGCAYARGALNAIYQNVQGLALVLIEIVLVRQQR